MDKFKKTKFVSVAGANGFTGRFICLELLKRNKNFKVIIRPNTNIEWFDSKKIKVRFADLSNKKELQKALKGASSLIKASSLAFVNIDCVLACCANLNIKG